MRIALDYDETYTRDPQFWDEVIKLAQYRKHEIVCVTLRDEQDGAPGMPIRTIFTNGYTKRPFCDKLGEQFHVWIDDTPEYICMEIELL